MIRIKCEKCKFFVGCVYRDNNGVIIKCPYYKPITRQKIENK